VHLGAVADPAALAVEHDASGLEDVRALTEVEGE
jgi:hypothetical protein